MSTKLNANVIMKRDAYQHVFCADPEQSTDNLLRISQSVEIFQVSGMLGLSCNL